MKNIRIGVSKLCCFPCETIIKVFKERYKQNISIKGGHGKVYPNWTIPGRPTFLDDTDMKCIIEIFGRSLQTGVLISERLKPDSADTDTTGISRATSLDNMLLEVNSRQNDILTDEYISQIDNDKKKTNSKNVKRYNKFNVKRFVRTTKGL